MQVVKLACRGGFKDNSDEHLQHGVACYAYASVLLLHPELKQVSEQQLDQERDLLSTDASPGCDIMAGLLAHKDPTGYCSRHQVCPHPANWIIWSAERICSQTLSHPVVLFAPTSCEGPAAAGPSPGAEFEDAGDSDMPSSDRPRLAVIHPPAAPFMQVAVDGR